MKIEILTKEFAKSNPEEAWGAVKLRRNLNKLSNYDFTPFYYKGKYLNVKNMENYMLPLITKYKITENNSTNFATYAGFSDIVFVCKAFFVLTPELITKHFVKIKKIILNDLIPQAKDELTKERIYRCLTDLKSIKVDYQLEQEEKSLN